MARQIPPRVKNPFCIKKFAALGLPIVPRTHFRTHRTRRWVPDQPGRHGRRFTALTISRGLRTRIQSSRIGRQRLLGRSGRVIRRSHAVRTLGRTQISSNLSLQSCVSHRPPASNRSPESSRSQASCLSVEIHNYIELRYKLC